VELIVLRRVAAENLLQFKHVATAKEANFHLPAVRAGIFIGAAGLIACAGKPSKRLPQPQN